MLGAIFMPTSYDDREGARILASLLEERSLCLADLGYRGVAHRMEEIIKSTENVVAMRLLVNYRSNI